MILSKKCLMTWLSIVKSIHHRSLMSNLPSNKCMISGKVEIGTKKHNLCELSWSLITLLVRVKIPLLPWSHSGSNRHESLMISMKAHESCFATFYLIHTVGESTTSVCVSNTSKPVIFRSSKGTPITKHCKSLSEQWTWVMRTSKTMSLRPSDIRLIKSWNELIEWSRHSWLTHQVKVCSQ